MDPRRAVRPARVAVHRLDLSGHLHIGPRARRERALAPRVIPAGGDTQRATQGGHGMHGLMCGHELESLDGIEVVSRANQAAAFLRISRSSRSARFSRRSRRTSSCSTVVSPSWRRPASRSACRTQFRIAWAEGSNCRPSSSGVRPFRTSSTMRCRNSAGYRRWLFGIVDAPFRPNHGVSTKPGQLHSVPSTGSFGVRQLIDNLEARREPWGISYFVVLEPYIGPSPPSWPTSPARGNFGILATSDDFGAGARSHRLIKT